MRRKTQEIQLQKNGEKTIAQIRKLSIKNVDQKSSKVPKQKDKWYTQCVDSLHLNRSNE